MPTVFKPPVDVSPLIRDKELCYQPSMRFVYKLISNLYRQQFGRWSFLLAGISYGAFWQSRYTSYELSVKDQKIKEKEAKLARIAAEKKAVADREMQEFEKIAKGSK